MAERVVIGSLEYEDNSGAAIQSAQRNLESLKDSVEGAAVATEDLETNQLGLLSAFEKIERKIDPVARAQQAYERDLKKVEAAIEAQAVSHERGARAIEQLEGKLQRAKDRAESYSASAREAAEEQERQARETERLARSMESLENRLNPAAAAQKRFEAESNDVREALRRQVISADQAGDMLNRLEREYEQGGAAADRFERRTRGAGGAVRLLAGALAGISLGLLAREVVEYADAWAAAENRLRLVTESTSELREVQSGLYGIAQDNFASFAGTADLYNRLSIGTEKLSLSQERLLAITDTVAKSIAISGASTQAAEAAVTQFGQALSADFKGAAQEINSIIEQTPGLARALAQGLGVSAGELKALAKEGKLSTEEVIAALERVGPAVDRSFGRIDPTLSQIGVTAKNAAQQISDAFAEPLLDEFKTDLQGLVAYMESDAALSAARRFGEVFSDWIATYRTEFQILNELMKSSGGEGEGPLEWYERQLEARRALNEETLKQLQWEKGIGGELETANQQLAVAQERYERIAEARARIDRPLFSGAAADGVVEKNLQAVETAKSELEKLLADYNKTLRESGERPFFLPDLNYEQAIEQLRQAREEVDPLTASILSYSDIVKKAGDETKRTGLEISNAFDMGPLQFDEQRLRAQIEAVRLGEDQVAALEREQKIEAEILKIKQSGKAFDEDAVRAQLELNDALEAELSLEQRRADRKRDVEDLEKLVEAARLGETQLTLARERLEVEAEIAELKLLAERAGVEFDEQAERDAIARRNALEAQLDELQGGFRGVTRGFDRDLARVVDSFVDDLAENGADAFENLADFAWRSFKQALLSPLKNALTGLLQGVFSGGGFGGGIPVQGVGGFTPGTFGGANPASSGLGGFGDIFSSFGSFASVAAPMAGMALGGGANVFGIGSLLSSSGALGQGVAGIGNFLGLSGGLTDAIAEGLSSAFSPSNALGGMAGGLLSSAVFGNSTASNIGSTLGGVAGSFIPFLPGPIGSAIGSFLGGGLGSLFAGKPSDKTAQGVFNIATGAVAGKAQDKGASQNAEIRDAAMGAITEGLPRLLDLIGGQYRDILGTAANEAFLNVAVRSDRKNGTPFIEVGYQGVNGEPTGGGRFDATEEGLAEAVNKGLQLALQTISGGDAILAPVAKALAAANEPVDNIVATLEQLQAALSLTEDDLSQWEQRVQQVGDVFDPLIEKTRALGSAAAAATAELEAANREALRKIGEDFDKEVRNLGLGLTAPLQLAAEGLLDEQMQRLEDAKAVSLDAADAQRRVNEVMAVNADQWSEFIEQAGSSPEALEQLADAIAAVAEKAREAGADTALLEQQLDQARASFAEAFDKESKDLLLNLTNAPLARFQALLEQQQARINTAASTGGDVRLAQEVAGAQREQFFNSLSDEDRLQLADFLGLIEDYTGRMGVVITQARDVFASVRDEQKRALEAAEDLAGAWSDASKSISEALKDAEERFGGQSRREQLDTAQAQFNSLLERLNIGDKAAAEEIPEVANRLLELIEQGYGTTPEGIRQTQDVLAGLRRADELAAGFTTAAESEAERIRKDDERLAAIEKALQQPDLAIPYLEEQIGLLDTSTSQGQQIVDLLTEYLSLSTSQQIAAGLQVGAVQAAAEQYLGAPAAAPQSGISAAQLTDIAPSASLAVQTAQSALGNRDLELAQTQLLTETAASSRGTRVAIEDFLNRAAGAEALNTVTLDRIEAATRATTSAVQNLETTARAAATDEVTAMAGLTLAMTKKYDEITNILAQSRDYLRDIATDIKKVRLKLEEA